MVKAKLQRERKNHKRKIYIYFFYFRFAFTQFFSTLIFVLCTAVFDHVVCSFVWFDFYFAFYFFLSLLLFLLFFSFAPRITRSVCPCLWRRFIFISKHPHRNDLIFFIYSFILFYGSLFYQYRFHCMTIFINAFVRYFVLFFFSLVLHYSWSERARSFQRLATCQLVFNKKKEHKQTSTDYLGKKVQRKTEEIKRKKNKL